MNDVEKGVTTEMVIGRVDGIAEVHAHELALFLPCHVIRQPADTNADLQDHVVLDRSPLELE